MTPHRPAGFYLELLLPPEEGAHPPAPHQEEDGPPNAQGPPILHDLRALSKTPTDPSGGEPPVQEENLKNRNRNRAEKEGEKEEG